MDVLVKENIIVESWRGIDVKKHLHTSNVWVRADGDSPWEEYGIIGHQAMMLSGLSGRPAELGAAIAELCSVQLKRKVTFVGAAPKEEVEEFETEESEEQ